MLQDLYCLRLYSEVQEIFPPTCPMLFQSLYAPKIFLCSDNTRTQDYTPKRTPFPNRSHLKYTVLPTYAVRHVPHKAYHSDRIHRLSCFCQHRSFSDKVYILCNNSSQYFHNLVKCRRCLFQISLSMCVRQKQRLKLRRCKINTLFKHFVKVYFEFFGVRL